MSHSPFFLNLIFLSYFSLIEIMSIEMYVFECLKQQHWMYNDVLAK